jgi:hypothetical protein
MTFPQKRRASFLGRVEILTNGLRRKTNAPRRKTNAFQRKRREARACDINIASLIESSDFFWDFRESRADYGVPIAEFFCGVIVEAMALPPWGCSQPGSRVSRSTRESRRHNTFSRKIRWNCHVSRFSTEPGGASAPKTR